MAVDSVIMVIDAGKGIEKQTKKLFEVCRKRKIPVFTFVNKLDRPARDTLSLIDEIESVLAIGPYPMNLPLGNGPDFKGVWDRRTKQAHLFERTAGGAFRAPVQTGGLDDPSIRSLLSDTTYQTVSDELELIEAAGTVFDEGAIANGDLTPVFFGSAVNNFGIQLLLDCFIEYAPPPQPRMANEAFVQPEDDFFSGFIFKIQANMDPRHRDRMAFVRIVSGTFTRDKSVIHVRTGKKIRLSNFNNVFGNERVSIDEAYPGDVVGVVGGDFFSIGDTLCEKPNISFNEIPRFPPECFSYIHNPNPSNFKRFQAGLEQLAQEGLVQLLTINRSGQKTMVLGAVGPLQFEMVKYRLESEYGALSTLEPGPWTFVRWIASVEADPAKLYLPFNITLAKDNNTKDLLLFEGAWQMETLLEKNASLKLSESPLV